MANKEQRYRFSRIAVVPVIFAGMAFIAVLITPLLAHHYQQLFGQDVRPMILLWATLCALSIFLCSLLAVRRLLKPTRKFLQRIGRLPVMTWSDDGFQGRKKTDEGHIENVLERIEDVLARMEARHLFPEIIGESRIMRELLGGVQKAAGTETVILLTGERGTGKGLAAASIHINSHRRQYPFIKLQCTGITPELLEIELCGDPMDRSNAGSNRSPGIIEQARSGTVFIDEIGELPLRLQAVILQVIMNKELGPGNGGDTVSADVRIIAATAKNLEQMVYEGTFREDLYDKIKLFSLHLPPLRNRRADIPLLVEDFLVRTAPRSKMSPQALQTLIGHSWPGNVRELFETVESALVMSQGRDIAPAHLPETVAWSIEEPNVGAKADKTISIDDKLQEIEKGMIINALKKTDGIQVRAAELMGINQRSLWHRIKKYQIDPAAYKSEKSG